MCKKGGTAIIRPFIRAFFLFKNKGEIYMKNEKDYYLTTAITYTSGKPHIGNTYEIILADAIARF